MSALTEILDALADQIRTVTDADTRWDVQVEPRMVLSPTPPSIDMYPGEPATEPELAGFGATSSAMNEGHVVNVRARVGPTDHEANQEVLLALADPEDDICLVQAVYDDATLDGHLADAHMLSESGFVLVPTIDGANVHIGVIWRFLLIPARS